MANWNPRANEVFLNAVKIASPQERRAFLDAACVDDADLRRAVEALLQTRVESGDSLEHPAKNQAITTTLGPTNEAHPGRPASFTRTEQTGTMIAGRYKLLEKLGEGGMGTVWMAEQNEPVKRMVALKVIRAGMDSAQVISRFEAERQTLALMDHPNIAKVLDAGNIPYEIGDLAEPRETVVDRPHGQPRTGMPFFVMELVKGVPITRFCDERQMSLRERLSLFIPVCQAVQHAHQKGIIHRDIKPSNVLIALYDGRPVPKIIDFGVAKATGQELTERTMFTAVGAIVGTLEYMSPEQAKLNPIDIDTRSDIYSLGVLLYELLTGSTPIERKRLQEGAILEVLRVIREEEPPLPSVRLSSSEMLPSLSASRHTEPMKLTQLVRGELDWIVMRALEKDRDRRYETANDMARDIERFLKDEPVTAGPPTATYRLRKFLKRHRGSVLAAAVVLLALLTGFMGTSWGLVEAKSQRVRAERALEEEAHQRTLAQDQTKLAMEAAANERRHREQAEAAQTKAEKSEQATAHALKKALEAEADTESFSTFLVHHVLAAARPRGIQSGLGVKVTVVEALTVAEKQINVVFAGRPKAEATARHAIGVTWRNLGKFAAAEASFRRALELRERELGPDAAPTLFSRNSLGVTLDQMGRPKEAVPILEVALKQHQDKLGPDDRDTLVCMDNLAVAYDRAGRSAEAIRVGEEFVKRMRALRGPDDPDTVTGMNNLALAYSHAGRLDDAIRLHEEALQLALAKGGSKHSITLRSMANLAMAYQEAARYEEAMSMHQKALEGRKAELGPQHYETVISLNNLAHCFWKMGKLDQSIPLFEESLRIYQARDGAEAPTTIQLLFNLAVNYGQAGRMTDALRLFHEGMQAQRSLNGPESPLVAGQLDEVGAFLVERQAFKEAEPFLRECLALRMTNEPNHWLTFSSRAMLGACFLGQKKYLWSEPLLLQGYEGMKQREHELSSTGRARLEQTRRRLIHLYEVQGKTEQAATWRKKQPPAR